jgi:hypothetical protein
MRYRPLAPIPHTVALPSVVALRSLPPTAFPEALSSQHLFPATQNIAGSKLQSYQVLLFPPAGSSFRRTREQDLPARTRHGISHHVIPRRARFPGTPR